MTTTKNLNAAQMQAIVRARRELALMRQYVRATGLTGWVKDRNAIGYYESAFYRITVVEDRVGVDAAAALADRLREFRYEAQRAGLIDVAEVSAAEGRAIAKADAERARVSS